MSTLQVEVSYRQILKIAGPISLALLVPNLNFIINNVFLGHLSEEALAVASITGVYYLIFSSIGYGLNNGLQALISRRAGENRPEEIGKIFHQGILVALSMALLAIILTYTIAPPIIRSVVRTPETAVRALSFLRIRIWGLPFLYVYQMRNALLVGTNNSKLLVAGTVVEAAANVFFDYALIFGHFGLPEVGFNGAAYASIVAEFLGMFAIFLVIWLRGLSRQFSLFNRTGWDPENIRAILRLSGPLIFQHAISITSWFFFYILIERNSDQTGLAVSNTMRTIFGFFGVTVWALAATSNAMVSNIIGQKRFGLVSLHPHDRACQPVYFTGGICFPVPVSWHLPVDLWPGQQLHSGRHSRDPYRCFGAGADVDGNSASQCSNRYGQQPRHLSHRACRHCGLLHLCFRGTGALAPATGMGLGLRIPLLDDHPDPIVFLHKGREVGEDPCLGISRLANVPICG
jgi:putative MATE family efflux protein